jgi:hypothetical protein
MSQVAVVTCHEGIVIGSESRVSYERGPAHGLLQKVHALGPRLVFAAVGNATMPDPRVDHTWPGLAFHLRTLTGGEPIEGDPLEVAERLGIFFVDVLGYLADNPRGGEGLAVATWRVEYVVAGYGPGSEIGLATAWEASPAGAGEFHRAGTDQRVGRVALGVYSEWPHTRRLVRRPVGKHAEPAPEPPPYRLERGEADVRKLLEMACERHPGACGPPLQLVALVDGAPLRWLERPDWIDSD